MSGNTEIILCGVFMGVLWILARRIGYRKGFREGFKYGYFCMKGRRKGASDEVDKCGLHQRIDEE